MSSHDFAALADRTLRLSNQIKPLLSGRGADVQGAVLADLVSMWLAAHHPALRGEVMEDWLAAVRQLVPESEREIFPRGKPPGW